MRSRLSIIRLIQCRISLALTQRMERLSVKSQGQRLSTVAGSSPAQALAGHTVGITRVLCGHSRRALVQQYFCRTTCIAEALQAGQGRGLLTCCTVVADALVADEANFLAPASVSYRNLGLHPAVQEALQRTGYSRPAQVQALSTPPILEGKNVVLAAETGSGKTLAYLVPVISALLDAARPDTGDLSNIDATSQGALVLCPNAALCDQVVKFANQLHGEEGEPLVRTARVAATHPPPRRLPHVVVATPAGLINATREFPDAYGRHWTKDGIIARMRWVVVDEADLLLTGGFKRDVRMILSSMKEGDRIAAAESVCHELGMEVEQFWEMPRALQRTAVQGGVPALLAAGFVPPSTPRGNEASSAQPSSSHTGNEEDWPQEATRRRTWKRQLIFVAATMPSDGDKSVATELQQVCPDALWLSGERLHQPQRQVHHSWHRVTEETWKSKLQEVVSGDEDLRVGKGRMLVFAGTVASAESAAAILRKAGLTPLIYHREIPAEERDNILSQAASRDGIVLVCTDAAARGIDIPHVTHVVQADFAGSAVDFLHRVGRTGRAGQRGKVTSLYLPGVEVLAEAIQEAVEAGEPVEGAFSRNRSFRKKLRKYGRYVPRGQVA